MSQVLPETEWEEKPLMTTRLKLIFVSLCLFPFVLAMGIRSVDNYRYREHKAKLKVVAPVPFEDDFTPGQIWRHCAKTMPKVQNSIKDHELAVSQPLAILIHKVQQANARPIDVHSAEVQGCR